MSLRVQRKMTERDKNAIKESADKRVLWEGYRRKGTSR